jgi:uncharacterized protein with FMN-binding domain
VRARAVVAGVLSSAAVLVLGWQLGDQPATTLPSTSAGTAGSGTGGTGTGGSTGTGGTGTGGSTGTGGTASGGTGGSSASSPATFTDGTYTGDAAQTQYGPVQVRVTVSGGRLTDVEAVQLTDRDGRSVAISQQAAPVLRQEALQAQSASIQAVSGATYTSEGYVTSLQSALDQAAS